ncbi:MAG: hypothetical protein JWP97_6072 [Labilithrix sp.]|nr:hypothetical protein [Labilithrix sp.]
MFRRTHARHALVSLGAALVTSVLAAGCGDDTQATPRVIFDSQVTPGTHTTTECAQTGTWFTIGNFGNPAAGRSNPADPNSPLLVPPVPVDDGGEDQQGTVTITCNVKESGDQFDVAATAQLTGAFGGAVTIAGKINRGTDSPDVTMNVTRKGETYSSRACTVSFDTSLNHAVAAGRIWANITCPDAEAPSQQKVCRSSAQFRFENCGQ